jgi:hypothetical protein
MTMVKDNKGLSYENLLSRVLTSKANGLGICGCGQPERVADMVRRYLEALNWAWEKGPAGEHAHYWKERWPKMEERAKLSEDSFLLCAYLADTQDLTEHGGSVFGSWLSDKGRAVLADLEAVKGELV